MSKTRQTNKSAIGKESRQLSSNINPLKRLAKSKEKEYAHKETAEDNLDLDVNNNDDDQEKINSEIIENKSPKLSTRILFTWKQSITKWRLF